MAAVEDKLMGDSEENAIYELSDTDTRCIEWNTDRIGFHISTVEYLEENRIRNGITIYLTPEQIQALIIRLNIELDQIRLNPGTTI